MSGMNLELEFSYKNKRYQDAAAGLKALGRDLADAEQRIAPILKQQLLKYLQSTAETLAQRHSTPYPGGTTPTTLSRRSGNAIASIKGSVRVTGQALGDIKGHIGGAFYLRIQEFGGTIRPKNSKYLTIPLGEALNADGTPKKKSAREWNNTFVAMSKAGNLIIFQKRGRQIVPLYVLKKQVTIPARLGMGKALRDGIDVFVDAVASEMWKGLLA